MVSRDRDWPEVMDRLARGEHTAFLEVSRLVTGFLVRWRAYDFRDEWDDLIQEVILAAVEAWRARRLRKPGAIVGYLRTATRYKFVDQLRRRRGEPLEDGEGNERPADLRWPPAPRRDPGGFEIFEQVDKLPENQRKCIYSVYVAGNTYNQAATVTGIPLGSLKRHLREGLSTLRAGLAEYREKGDPVPSPDPTDSSRGAGRDPDDSGGRRERR
jgi:RNA polymerase sigma-70 factor (ECF subfamily)